MIDRRSLLIRADASVQVGSGHVMRMIALGQAWQDRGGQVVVASIQCPPRLAARLQAESFRLEDLDVELPGSTGDREQTIRAAQSCSCQWVAMDGYAFTADFHAAVRNAGMRTLVVDDYGQCQEWHTDIVINQNIYAENLACYSAASDVEFLLGLEYALLRREFLKEVPSGSLPRPVGRKILVTLGGSDPDNATEKILHAFDAMSEAGLAIRVILGGSSRHLEAVRQAAKASVHSVHVLHDVQDMAAQYRWADGVVSAAGSTCWEWLRFGLPACVVVIADNQRLVAEGLAEQNLAVNLGWYESVDPQVLRTSLSEWMERIGESGCPRPIPVDGLGAHRVVARMDGGVWLRPAHRDDVRFYFALVNEPAVRENSLQTAPISWEVHSEWFERRIQSADSRLYVAVRGDAPVGQVRFDRNGQGDWEVDFSVAAGARGRGYGISALLQAVCRLRQESDQPIIAHVRSQNAASARCFESLGFTEFSVSQPGLQGFRLDRGCTI